MLHALPAVSRHALPSVDELVSVLRPEAPLSCVRPATLAAEAAAFVTAFPGETLYAVKCNPDPAVLRALWAGGVRHFDCASLAEIRHVRALLPDAAIHFMHPVKSRRAIADAYAFHDVRDFVLDSDGELDKIFVETGGAGDLGLVVRLALPPGVARIDLSGKFGAAPADAVRLLRRARPRALRLGLAFHVGSQCTDPLAWRRALALAGAVIAEAGVPIDIVDVGGGFPAAYPGEAPPPTLGAFFAEIEAGVEALPGSVAPRLWAEPGRALVASGASAVLRVEGRRGRALHVNDGVYGGLSDAGALGFRYPARLLRPSAAAAAAFELLGPTCDGADRMRGPFMLPDDVREGDWIELGQLGAYGTALATGFNGFGAAETVPVRDEPLPV